MTQNISAASSLREQIQQLIAKWRTQAKDDAVNGVQQATMSHREYFGRVNAALAYDDCANRLAALLAAEEEAKPPKAGGDGAPVASCLLCGHSRPLAVWYSGTRAGVCEECRKRAAEPERATTERHGPWEGIESDRRKRQRECRHVYWDLGYCIDCGIHSNDPLYAQQLRERAATPDAGRDA
jgi:hypothetical protein